MNEPVEATWGTNGREVISSVEELDALLERVDASARRAAEPEAVELIAGDGAGTLSIVVGHDRSVLSHVPASGDPPYTVSRGDEDEDRAFTFFVYGGHHTESDWGQTVPAAEARQAARTFLLTGRLDDRLRWEEI